MDALRDWGHAKDYVRMQWMMLQQDQAEDYVIATGKQISVRDFVYMSANELGIKLQFSGQGANETVTVVSISGSDVTGINVGDTVIRVDP
jgi:GDPmannose 4,6-dehydratase